MSEHRIRDGRLWLAPGSARCNGVSDVAGGVVIMPEEFPPDIIAEAAKVLYAAQETAAAAGDRAIIVAMKRGEVEAVLGVLRRLLPRAGQPPAEGPNVPGTSLVDRRQIAVFFGLRKSAAYDLTRREGFPAPVVVSPRCLRWEIGEVVAYARTLKSGGARRPGRRYGRGRAPAGRTGRSATITGTIRTTRRPAS